MVFNVEPAGVLLQADRPRLGRLWGRVQQKRAEEVSQVQILQMVPGYDISRALHPRRFRGLGRDPESVLASVPR